MIICSNIHILEKIKTLIHVYEFLHGVVLIICSTYNEERKKEQRSLQNTANKGQQQLDLIT